MKSSSVHLKACAKYRLLHPDRVKISRRINQLKNPERNALSKDKWRKKNQVRVSTRQRFRRQNDPIVGLISRIRSRIAMALRTARGKKLDRSICLLGCSPRQFKRHLESLFLPGMSWVNRQLWHIDHEKPISSFDLSTLEGQQAAFHYTNCQPLWALDNLRKGATV